MAARPAQDRVDRIVRICYAGLDAAQLRHEFLLRLRRIMTVDAAFFATVDPSTILMTSVSAEEPLGAATSQFVDNEFGHADVNKFAELAEARNPVSSLDRATRGERGASARYREVMAPLHLGDELRAALVSRGRCWGVICLHREDSTLGFDQRDLQLIRQLAPHLAEGLRRAVLAGRDEPAGSPADGPGPGVVVLDADLAVASASPEAEHWLAQVDDVDWPSTLELPVAVYSAVARVRSMSATSPPPTVRLRTRAGRWLTVHASQLNGSAGPQTAVVLGPTTPDELNSLLLDAHGLTPAQQRVTEQLLRGHSTRQIVDELHISAYTVQEHLRAAFDKFGVGSRRELIAALTKPR